MSNTAVLSVSDQLSRSTSPQPEQVYAREGRTAESLALPTADTPVPYAVFTRAPTRAQQNGFQFLNSTDDPGLPPGLEGSFEQIFTGPATIEVTASIAGTLAAPALQELLIQAADDQQGTTWRTVAIGGPRIQDTPADVTTISATFSCQSGSGRGVQEALRADIDSGVAFNGETIVTRGDTYRIAFQGDTNADSAEVYNITVKLSRPEGIHGMPT
jgi:hypothetical protein